MRNKGINQKVIVNSKTNRRFLLINPMHRLIICAPAGKKLKHREEKRSRGLMGKFLG